MEKTPSEIITLYAELEDIRTFDKWDLTKRINALSEIYLDKWKDVLTYERISLNFTLKNGYLAPLHPGISRDGKEFGFPMINDISTEAIEYFKERANQTKNQFLISRYNHILFEALKNQLFAHKAIVAYKKIICMKSEKEITDRIFEYVPAILHLTEKTKFNLTDTKKELSDLLVSIGLSVTDKFIIAKNIALSSLFKTKELNFLPELLLEWVNEKKQNYFQNREILLLAIDISLKNKLNTNIFYEKLAENEDALLSEHTDDKDFIKPTIYANKMSYYKKAKNDAKYNEALLEYTRLKSLVELDLVQIPFDEKLNKILNESLNEQLEQLMKMDSNAILLYISGDSRLFPDMDFVIKQAKTSYDNSFLKFVSLTTFDINNNTKKLTEKEELEYEISKTFQFNYSNSVTIFFIKLLAAGILNGKFTYQKLYLYLEQYSWFGKEFPKSKMKIYNDKKTYRWLDILAPGIHNFFIYAEAFVLSGFNPKNENWTLSIDSLTLKFEGALRDLIRLTGGTTTKIKNKENAEMLLEDLLNTEKSKKIFSENDLFLFKMIFTNRGANIRNDVAHGFYTVPEDYSFEKACKVFLCILRLSNRNLSPTKE